MTSGLRPAPAPVEAAATRIRLEATTRRLLWAALPAAAAVAVVAVAVAAASSGAFGPSVFGDPGPAVRWSAPVVRALGHLAAAVTIGALLLVAVALPAPAPPVGRRSREGAGSDDPHDGAPARAALAVAGFAGAAWTLLAATRLVLDYATIVGESPAAPTFGEQLGLFVTQLSLGRILLSLALLAALTSTLAFAAGGPTGAAWALVPAGVALGLLAEAGHAAGTASHDLAVSAMGLHLIGAAVWIGGLATLIILAGRLGPGLGAAVARFSTLALWAFLAVAISGAASAWLRVGDVAALATPYGRLVVVKVLLIGVLGAVGYAHRRATVSRLNAPSRPQAGAPAGWRTVPAAFWRLAAAELVVMGAVSGVAVALAGSEPPVPQEPPTVPSPTEASTGYAVPPYPTPETWLTQWRPEAVFSLIALTMVVVYVRWVKRLRRRGDAWPVGRTVSWVVGAVTLFWVTNGWPAVYGPVLFSAHMLMHMVLAMVTPVLFVLAAPVTLALRALPVRRDGSRGPREWLLWVVESWVGRIVANPLVAAVGFVASMIVFYMTPLFDVALSSHAGHLVMVVHFSLVGYLFANALIGIDPGPRRPAYPIRLVLLFATVAFHAFFGVALAESTVLLAADWYGALGLPWWVDALADQQQGAYLAWAIGEAPTLALAAAVAVRWAREDERTARRADRAAARDGEAELAAYNAMLAWLAQQDQFGRDGSDRDG